MLASGIDRHPDRTEMVFSLQIIESSFLVSILFREVFSHPYISFFHLLVNAYCAIAIYLECLPITHTQNFMKCKKTTKKQVYWIAFFYIVIENGRFLKLTSEIFFYCLAICGSSVSSLLQQPIFFTPLAHARAGGKVIGVGVNMYNWRASEASETLSGLFN